MTDILCRWLNEDVKLSRIIDPTNIAKEFSTGYLLGELLNRHGLQEDFSMFSQNTTSDSKLHNFTQLEPTLKLLEVPYDTNVARAIMNENHSAITRLMYQLFISLGKKSKAGLTGVAMETMRPSGPVKLESIESGLYKERLKQLTKRQVDLNFEQLVQRYQAKQKEQEEKAFKAKFHEEERMRKYFQGQRQQGLDKSRQMKQKQLEMMGKIRDASVKIPKPPDSKKTTRSRSDMRRQKEAEEVKESIDAFEASLRAVIPPASPIGFEGEQSKREVDTEIDAFLSGSKSLKKPVDPLSYIKPTSNEGYINKIRTRLEEDSVARKEREKRRRRVLIEQMKAHEAQEEAHREEMLVNRLMRQSQQERRIAVQLMQVRHEKEVIRQNRILREKQYAERRLKDFDDALTREAELCRQAKIEYAEETRKAQELHDKIKAEIAEAKYNKHYNICWEVLSQIVDFSCKIGEYRELTEKLIPPKMFREWKALFLEGLPIYEDEPVDLASNTELAKLREIEKEKEDLMDEGDFLEYKNLIGEWTPAEESDLKGPPKDNAVLGHIIHRLFNIVSPPEPPPPPPEFPPFPIKVCFLGKFFSGKTSTINKILEGHRMVRLSVDDLVAEAVEAYKNNECIEEPPEELPVPDEDSSPKKVSIQELAVGESQTTTPQSAQVGEGKETGEAGKGSEDPNKMEEKQTSDAQESEEKRDKTKEELEKESLEAKDDERKTPSKPKELEPVSSKTKGPTLTTRAKLGSKAYGFLKKGKATPDQLLVDIMVEAVRQVPDGTGWIMDGFPGTINQAKLLEKALSGYDAQREAKDAKAAKEPSKVSKTRKSRLAPDPHPPTETPALKSGIDLVLLFDLPDDIALKRAEGRTYNPSTADQYHQEYNPPVEGSYTGINKQEKVVPVTDPSNDREQVQQRIFGFVDGWPKLEKWFTKFGIFQRIDANTSQEQLYDEVSGLLNETYQKLIAPPEEAPSEPSVQPGPTTEGEQPAGAQSTQGEGPPTEGVASESAAAPPESVPAPSEAPSEAGVKPESKSEKGTSKSKGDSKPGSPKSRKSKKDRSPSPQASKKGAKSRSPTPPSSKKGSRSGSKSPSASRKGSRPGSKGSRPGSKRAKSPKKGAEEVEEEKPPEPQGPPEPEPGSEDWEYVDQPIEVDFAGVLTSQWENSEETYIDSCKKVFGEIRRERELIHRYFYGTRKDFVQFLKRPDEKQEYVQQWQKSYNEVAEDMRGDEDTKAELHQQLDDLCDRLYDICDNRKEMAEKERQSVMSEGWLEDRLGLLTNFYVTLMQAEVDRYQDTVRLLRDYYVGMEGKIPNEAISEYARLPLVELPLSIRPQSASSKSGGSESVTNLTAAEKTEVKSPSGRKEKDKGATKTPEPTETQEEEQKPRIPLVPRRPKSGEPGTGRGKDKKGDKKKGQGADPDKPETPVAPSDPDEKLVFDAYIVALTIIETMAQIDQTEQEAEAIRQAELEKEKEREALQKKAKEKKDKKGRKSPGKGASPSKNETPPPPPPEEREGQSEEEQLKQKTKERARKEFLGSVASEDSGLKARLEMIKNHAITVLQELKGKADSTYKDMDDWLGARFLQEVESIKEMAENVRFAIEKEEKLQEEVLLEDKDFIVDLDTKTFKTPTPPPPPSPTELPQSDIFTVNQLLNLYRQLVKTAPSGVISNRAFCDTIMDMTAVTYGMELLPDSWMNITQQQLQDVSTVLALETEFIDWRRFLLAATQPWPPASKMDLLLTLERCREVDTTLSGRLTQDEFEQVDLWFFGQEELEHPQDPDVPPVFDRQGKLKNAFFQIFSDNKDGVLSLDYVDMLLYFAADPDPLEGFLRGLSVVSNQPMPFSKSLVHLPQPMTDEYGGDVSVPQIQQPQSPPPEMSSLVTLENLMRAFRHGEGRLEDTYRLSLTADPDDTFAKERLAGVFGELGAEESESVPFHLLYQHPIIQDCMHMCQRFKTVDLRNSFSVECFE